MADVSSFFCGGGGEDVLFSLDPGIWPDQQLAEPALGRHHLPHRLGRQAVRLQAADQTCALLPRPLCIQIPCHCHLLYLYEGEFGSKFYWTRVYLDPIYVSGCLSLSGILTLSLPAW